VALRRRGVNAAVKPLVRHHLVQHRERRPGGRRTAQ
jgi:hypothetical protein